MFGIKQSLTVCIIICGIVLTANACTVTMEELAIWSGGSIGTGSGVAITGPIASAKGINLNTSSSVNSVYTAGSIWLGSKVTVSGEAIANKGIDKSKTAVITGYSNGNAGFELPKLDYLTQNTIGTTSVYVPWKGSTILKPGDYSSWSLSSNTTTNLSAGSYNLSSFWVGSGSVVNVDTSAGDVVLNVAGEFSVSSGVTFVSSGSGTLRVNVFKSDAWFDSKSKLTGIVSVYGGGLTTGSSVGLIGSVYATGNVYLGSDSTVTYSAFSIPEPTSLVIFATMSMFLVVRNQRRGAKGTSTAA
ncbi:MAG: hypothetical protein LLF92_04920 [Planctomycetaceae bacterium]|nr:hypothetical protein [Planctomycetaceae bacterium]